MINMTEYTQRRHRLMQHIGPQGILILFSAPEQPRNGDTYFPFRQNSDFYYLTGFSEPEAILVLAPHRAEGEYILFNRVCDPDRAIWDGPRAGQEGACRDFQADEAFPISEFEDKLPALLAGREVIHYPLGQNHCHDALLLDGLNTLRARIRGGLQCPMVFKDLTLSLHEARLIKSSAEISVMRKAVEITAEAHKRAMEICRPGLYEYQLEAELLHVFKRGGATGPAYPSIVGAGRNSCILHYISNHCVIEPNALVLIDAGSEYQNYASDITRTFPSSGRFTGEQKAIYELVLAAQLAAIRSIKPGVSWAMAQTLIVEIMTQGLIDLGILKGALHDLIETQAYFPFYMHRSGHWLGLDVHDVGRYRIENDWRVLQPGMVLTVEPGLYIPALPDVDPRWHHLGIRIEDDVVVTEQGCEVLSQDIPKTINDIEALMAD